MTTTRLPRHRRSMVKALIVSAGLLAACTEPLTLGTAAANDYVLGAYYFGMFSGTAFPEHLAEAERLYRRRDAWAGVRDFHGDTGVPQNTEGWTPLPTPPGLPGFEFTQLKPTIGYYDQDAQLTLEKHIYQARSHGLSFFNFYWYYKEDPSGYGGVREVINSALHHNAQGQPGGSFIAANDSLASRGAPTIKFMISVYANNALPHYAPLTRQGTIAAEIVRRRLNYMSRADYLRTRNNRPIITFGVNVNEDPTIVR